MMCEDGSTAEFDKMTTVHFGWLIRSIHSWSANLMVFFAFVHLATVFFVKAYRPPRELTCSFS